MDKNIQKHAKQSKICTQNLHICVKLCQKLCTKPKNWQTVSGASGTFFSLSQFYISLAPGEQESRHFVDSSITAMYVA